MVIASLVHLKVENSKLYKKALAGTLTIGDLSETYRLAASEPKDEDRYPYVLNRAWATFLSNKTIDAADHWRGFDPSFRLNNPSEELTKTIDQYLEQFEITLSE